MRFENKKFEIFVNITLMLVTLTIFFGSLEMYARIKYKGFNVKEKGFYCRGKAYSMKKTRPVYRIVCIGGSTTFGYGSNYKEAYPFYLEDILNKKHGEGAVEVINSGVAATATEFHRDLVKDRINDGDLDLLVIHSMYNHFSPFFPFCYDPSINNIVVESNKVKMKYNWGKMSLADKIKIFLMEHSYLYSLMREFISKLKTQESNSYLNKRAGYLLKYASDKEYEADSKEKRAEVVNDFMTRYRKAIEDMLLAAKAKNVKVVLIIPPYPFTARERDIPVETFRSGQFYNKVFKQAKEILLELADKYGVTVVDADRELLRVGRTPDLFTDSIHMTAKGNRQLANIIAAGISDLVSKKE